MPKLSRATRILLALKTQRRLTAGIHRNLLYSILSSQILQGILVEGTPYKGTVYVWRVCMPLYRPGKNLTLNFSQRLCHKDHQEYFTGDTSQIVNAIHGVVETSPGSYDGIFSQAMSAKIFGQLHVNGIDWGGRHMPGRLFEAGATFAVNGNFGQAEPCLTRCLAAYSSSSPDAFPMWQASKDYLDAMAIGEDAVIKLASKLETETRLTLGLDQVGSH